MNEEQRAFVHKIGMMCADVLDGKIPTYEDFIDEVDKAIETCPEP